MSVTWSVSVYGAAITCWAQAAQRIHSRSAHTYLRVEGEVQLSVVRSASVWWHCW